MVFPRPRSCLICNEKHQKSGLYICEKCYDKVKRVYPPLCSNCGRPLASNTYCTHCKNREYQFSQVLSFGIYEAHLRTLIHLFKYKKYSGIAYEIAKIMMSEMDLVNAIGNDILVPVPLHPNKVKTRGYNQSQVLCEALSKNSQLSWADLLIRKNNSPAQSTYNLKKRLNAVKGQFTASKNIFTALNNKNIVLVDDVITTGSTLNECAVVLKKCGVKRVRALTIATTLLK